MNYVNNNQKICYLLNGKNKKKTLLTIKKILSQPKKIVNINFCIYEKHLFITGKHLS